MLKKELIEFLLQKCKDRGLSLRRLSINAELSPGTVHSIIKREYEPSLFSLNRLADYLGVERQYLWQMAGLLEGRDYAAKKFGDPRMMFHFTRADKLPEPVRDLIISIIAAITTYFETAE